MGKTKGLICCMLGVLLSCSACTGWSAKPLTLDGAEKVYIPFFKNDTFYRRLEQGLTREVIKRVQEKPGLYLTDEDSADVVLKGRIMDYSVFVLSEDRQDQVIEGAATIKVKIQVVRRTDNKVLREKELIDTAEYNQLFNETVDSTRDESFTTLSRRIVDLLEVGF